MKGDFTRLTFRSVKHYSGVRLQQGRVQLDADWNEQMDIQAYRDETATRDVLGPCSGPFQEAGFDITITNGNNLIIRPGRYYVDGILCINDGPVPFTAQPDLPGEPLPTAVGTYLAYLDVWQRHLTALEDPRIREVALNGPDTATRTKTVWQVKMEAVGEDAICNQFGLGWKPISTQSTGQLRAQAEPGGPSAGPCIVPAGAGFRRLENQLYRVEIHTPGQARLTGAETITASFKWSRDNGSVVARLSDIDGNELTVSTPVKDAVLGFAAGHWVELSDEGRTLRGEPGFLVQLASVAGDTLTVKAWPNDNPLTLDDFGALPTVRRWDSEGEIPVTPGAFIELEDGVEIAFAEGDYRTGDYWLISARSLSGDVEWPQDESLEPPEPLFEPRHGIEHHYCPLALLQFNGQIWSPSNDCRTLFLPLTQQRGEDEPGIHIMGIQFLESGQPLRNDTDVPADQLAKGIQVVCDQSADRQAIAGKPTCFVTLHLPYPFNTADRELWGDDAVLGCQPLILAADAGVEEDGSISWRPTEATRTWLEQRLFTKMEELERGDRLLARLTLKGNFIWARDNPALYLDGEVFGKPGGQHTELRLHSGDGRPGGDFEMWFWVARDFAPDIDVTPTALDFSNVPVGQLATKELTVENTGGAVLNVSSIGSDNEFFKVTPTTFTVDAGRKRKVTVSFKPTTRGRQTGKLSIKSDDLPDRTVGVQGVGVAPDIDVTPTALNFSPISIGEKGERTFDVENTGNASLSVAPIRKEGSTRFSVVSPTGSFPVAADGGRKTVTVGFAPTTRGEQTETFFVDSNDPDKPTVSVAVQGVGVAPLIAVSPRDISFGEVELTVTKEERLTVTNTGNAELKVTDLRIIGAGFFHADRSAFTVEPRGREIVTVSYRPTFAVVHNAELTIASNDPENRTVRVPLNGKGVDKDAMKEIKDDVGETIAQRPGGPGSSPDHSAQSSEDNTSPRAEGKSFISPEERPQIGEKALKEPKEEKPPRARRPRKPSR